MEKHIELNTSWDGADWIEEKKVWRCKFSNWKTGERFVQECKVLISGTGGLVEPQKLGIEGEDGFEGKIIHSARWDHSVSLKDKNVCIIGNGCASARSVQSLGRVLPS